MNTLYFSPWGKFVCWCVFTMLQGSPDLTAQTKKYIRSHEYKSWQENVDPNLAHVRASVEDTLQATYKTVTVSSDPVVPVIFHVLYNNATEQISEATIYEQLDALNRDFGLKNDLHAHR